MPESRLQKCRDAYRETPEGAYGTPNDEATRWRPAHENTAERLKQAAQRITRRVLANDPA